MKYPKTKTIEQIIQTQLEWALAGMARSRNADKSEPTSFDFNPEPRHEIEASDPRPSASIHL